MDSGISPDTTQLPPGFPLLWYLDIHPLRKLGLGKGGHVRVLVPFCCAQFPRVKAGLCSSVCTPAVLPLLLTPSPIYTPAAQSALSSQEHAYMVLPFRWLYSLGIGASPAPS